MSEDYFAWSVNIRVSRSTDQTYGPVVAHCRPVTTSGPAASQNLLQDCSQQTINPTWSLQSQLQHVRWSNNTARMTASVKRRPPDSAACLDQIDLLIVQCSYDAAFQSLLDLVQPGKINRAMPEHRLHMIIRYLIKRVSKVEDAKALLFVCQSLARPTLRFSLLECVNIVEVLEDCLRFPSLIVASLEIFLSLMDSIACNGSYLLARIRQMLFPLCRSSDVFIQCLAIDCIARIIRLCPKKETPNICTHEEVTLLLSIIPRIIKQHALQNLLSALKCLLDVIPLAVNSVQSSSTSVMLLLQKCLAFEELENVPSLAESKFLLESIRLTTIVCLKKMAQFMPSLLSGCWASFLPASVASALDRNAFGGPTMVSLMIFDRSSKIRIASSEALVAMIEGAPLHSNEIVNCLSNRKAYSNPRVQETLDALHVACLLGLSGTETEAAVLKVVTCLSTRISYGSLPKSKKILSKIFLRLLIMLQNCNNSIKHELFTSLASVASAPTLYDDAVIDFALHSLLNEFRSDNDRSPPNSLTVIGRVLRRHSSVLLHRWPEIRCELLIGLRKCNEHVQISAVVLIEEWLSNSEETLNTFLSLEGGEEILGIVAHKAKIGSLNLKSKCLIALSRISRHSWISELTEPTRNLLTDLLKHVCCNENFRSFPERLQIAGFRFIGSLSSYCTDSSIMEEVLPQLLIYTCQARSGSVRSRAVQALSDMVDSLVAPSTCADILIKQSNQVLCCVDQCLRSANSPATINAIRICASLFRIDAFKDLAHSAIPHLLNLINDSSTSVKVQWNICRALGAFIASDFFDCPNAIIVLIKCIQSSNQKVALSALHALNHSPLFSRNPAFIQQFADAVKLCIVSCSDCEFKDAIIHVSSHLTESLGKDADAIKIAISGSVLT